MVSVERDIQSAKSAESAKMVSDMMSRSDDIYIVLRDLQIQRDHS